MPEAIAVVLSAACNVPVLLSTIHRLSAADMAVETSWVDSMIAFPLSANERSMAVISILPATSRNAVG